MNTDEVRGKIANPIPYLLQNTSAFGRCFLFFYKNFPNFFIRNFSILEKYYKKYHIFLIIGVDIIIFILYIYLIKTMRRCWNEKRPIKADDVRSQDLVWWKQICRIPRDVRNKLQPRCKHLDFIRSVYSWHPRLRHYRYVHWFHHYIFLLEAKELF